jgi:hypothetical protein
MRRQLGHLHRLSGHPHLDVRVLPFAAGWHPAWRGGFSLLELPGPADPDVVYVEAVDSARYLETATDLQRFRAMFASVHERSIPLEEFR